MRVNTQGLRKLARDESGFVMATVLGVSMILFILVTATIVYTNYSISQTTHYQSRIRGLQVADSGLNEYLYRMSINYDYNTALTATLEDGSMYTATRALAPDGMVQITSIATLQDGTSRTVCARCSPPHFADYAIGSTADILVGPETIIDGPIRTNGKISWSSGGTKSWVLGKVQSPVGYYRYNGSSYTASTDSAHFKGGTVPVAQAGTLNFDKISTDIDAMKTKAGLLLPASTTIDSGAKGYQIVFANNQAIVSLVMAEGVTSTTSTVNVGRLTTKNPVTYAIPANGVIFVNNDNVWVKGTYTARVTICASRTSSSDTKNSGCITVADSVLCGNKTNSAITCGLLAQNSVWLPAWYSRKDNGLTPPGVMDPILTIEAAMLAQNGSIGDGYSSRSGISIAKPQPYHDLNVTGASVGKGGIGFSSPTNVGSSTQTYGFLNRNYGFDPRLKTNPPPSWPKTGDSVVVSTWIEH